MLQAPSHYCAACWEFYAVEPTAITNRCPKCERVLTPRSNSEPVRYNQVTNGCWPAVLAGLTGIPHELLARHVPADNAFMHDDFAWAMYYRAVLAEMAAHGWTTQSIGQRVPKGYAVGIGKSIRGTDHAVIIRDGAVWHDPHESRAGIVTFIDYEIVIPIVRPA